jgi:pseudouridine-5'-phosphate glycosidase
METRTLNQNIPSYYSVNEVVSQALHHHQPVVALESAVITHGLPRPQNMELALAVEEEVRGGGALPATIALLDGKVRIGLTPEEVERLSYETRTRKISLRDYGIAIARGECGGTTVAGTLRAAHTVGITVFATGGIGGVHRGNPFDISADLLELSRTPLIVVCAGAKAILDLPATLEYLETMGVPVVGLGTDDFPAFYSSSSGLPVNVRAESAAEVAAIARAHWGMGLNSGILVTVPPPAELALPLDVVEEEIQQAVKDAEAQHIRGAGVTPFLLSRMTELSGGASMKVNLALLRNNAHVAAQIAAAFHPRGTLI